MLAEPVVNPAQKRIAVSTKLFGLGIPLGNVDVERDRREDNLSGVTLSGVGRMRLNEMRCSRTILAALTAVRAVKGESRTA